ncbi:hypothetical protein AGOR_G00098320 [Albula goreensis]|uniref:Uncharacterized protein n=1 Tax=Albula goreensis TaxID=1534307 RepID=A0A8T3DP96_9TELE|nr:hypothetical protein AGOR_G00098320 [Albula goreensis]
MRSSWREPECSRERALLRHTVEVGRQPSCVAVNNSKVSLDVERKRIAVWKLLWGLPPKQHSPRTWIVPMKMILELNALNLK